MVQRIGAMPVLGPDGVKGVFSERDVIYRLAEEGALCLDRPVAEVMSSPVITITPAMTVDEAQGLMTRRRVRHLPVVDNGEFCGFISIGDLVKSKIGEVESEASVTGDPYRRLSPSLSKLPRRLGHCRHLRRLRGSVVKVASLRIL